MSTKCALFTGRFQPPSAAHANTIRTILERWQSLLIGISTPSDDKDFDPAWTPFIETTRDRFKGSKAIFTPEETKAMWDGWIAHENLGERAVCKLVPRPYLREFTRKYPASEFDMVYPVLDESDSEGDRMRHRLFPELLEREIFLVEPTLRLHNTQIRREILAGTRTWEKSIAPGALEVFLALQGPERMSGYAS